MVGRYSLLDIDSLRATARARARATPLRQSLRATATATARELCVCTFGFPHHEIDGHHGALFGGVGCSHALCDVGGDEARGTRVDDELGVLLCQPLRVCVDTSLQRDTSHPVCVCVCVCVKDPVNDASLFC